MSPTCPILGNVKANPTTADEVAVAWLAAVREEAQRAGLDVHVFKAAFGPCGITFRRQVGGKKKSVTARADNWRALAAKLNRRFPGKEAARGG